MVYFGYTLKQTCILLFKHVLKFHPIFIQNVLNRHTTNLYGCREDIPLLLISRIYGPGNVDNLVRLDLHYVPYILCTMDNMRLFGKCHRPVTY
jgi:hypothetical protein